MTLEQVIGLPLHRASKYEDYLYASLGKILGDHPYITPEEI